MHPRWSADINVVSPSRRGFRGSVEESENNELSAYTSLITTLYRAYFTERNPTIRGFSIEDFESTADRRCSCFECEGDLIGCCINGL